MFLKQFKHMEQFFLLLRVTFFISLIYKKNSVFLKNNFLCSSCETYQLFSEMVSGAKASRLYF